MPGPLYGLRVMDVGTAGVGPWAATLLGLLGVVKKSVGTASRFVLLRFVIIFLTFSESWDFG